jgi:hypothetical protein
MRLIGKQELTANPEQVATEERVALLKEVRLCTGLQASNTEAQDLERSSLPFQDTGELYVLTNHFTLPSAYILAPCDKL